jgi:hypothetical protein
LKKEGHIVVFSAMVTEPPSVHELRPTVVDKNGLVITPVDADTSLDSQDEIREKARAKERDPNAFTTPSLTSISGIQTGWLNLFGPNSFPKHDTLEASGFI